MKRYYDLTKQEKLALSGEDIHDSIKLEAIHRGVKPPVTLDAVINQYGFTGFTVPPDATVFYELVGPSAYSSEAGEPCGIAFRTEPEAINALKNAVYISKEGYGADKKLKIRGGDFTYRAAFISLTKPQSFGSKLESYYQDDAEYDKLVEEIKAELNTLWQDQYNKQVRAERRKEYMRLAKGDAAIAAAFWSKAESGEFPAEEEV